MRREELDRLVYEYLCKTFEEIEDTLALDWSVGGLEEYGFQQNERAHWLTGALATLDYSPVIDIAREMAPDASEETLRKLARRLVEVQVIGIKAELAAINGDPLDRSPLRRLRPSSLSAISSATRSEPAVRSPSLSTLVSQYRAEKIALKRWTSRTEDQVSGYLQLMVELLGDPPVAEVTKDELRRLGIDLTRLPAHMTLKYPGMSVRQALDAAGDDAGVARLAPNSVNAYYQSIRSFFNWAVEHDHTKLDPAAILKDMKTGKASEERHPFNDEDLKQYFKRIDEKKGRLDVEYWVPRIMAYTGCRLGEAAQIRSEDVRVERGIWVLDINDAVGKNLKTDSSRRLVPLHARLIELGLPEFAAGIAAGFLWPEEMRTASTPTGSPVDKLQKRLAYLLRSAGIRDAKKTAAHSFRHTVSSRLKAHSVPEYQIAEILGHEIGSMSTGRYGSTTDLLTLKRVVDRLELPI